MDYLCGLNWSGANEFKHAKKQIWKVNSDDSYVAGFVRQAGKFTQAYVRGAGHMVPEDQAGRAYNLIHNFIHDIPFSQ